MEKEADNEIIKKNGLGMQGLSVGGGITGSSNSVPVSFTQHESKWRVKDPKASVRRKINYLQGGGGGAFQRKILSKREATPDGARGKRELGEFKELKDRGKEEMDPERQESEVGKDREIMQPSAERASKTSRDNRWETEGELRGNINLQLCDLQNKQIEELSINISSTPSNTKTTTSNIKVAEVVKEGNSWDGSRLLQNYFRELIANNNQQPKTYNNKYHKIATESLLASHTSSPLGSQLRKAEVMGKILNASMEAKRTEGIPNLASLSSLERHTGESYGTFNNVPGSASVSTSHLPPPAGQTKPIRIQDQNPPDLKPSTEKKGSSKKKGHVRGSNNNNNNSNKCGHETLSALVDFQQKGGIFKRHESPSPPPTEYLRRQNQPLPFPHKGRTGGFNLSHSVAKGEKSVSRSKDRPILSHSKKGYRRSGRGSSFTQSKSSQKSTTVRSSVGRASPGMQGAAGSPTRVGNGSNLGAGSRLEDVGGPEEEEDACCGDATSRSVCGLNKRENTVLNDLLIDSPIMQLKSTVLPPSGIWHADAVGMSNKQKMTVRESLNINSVELHRGQHDYKEELADTLDPLHRHVELSPYSGGTKSQIFHTTGTVSPKTCMHTYSHNSNPYPNVMTDHPTINENLTEEVPLILKKRIFHELFLLHGAKDLNSKVILNEGNQLKEFGVMDMMNMFSVYMSNENGNIIIKPRAISGTPYYPPFMPSSTGDMSPRFMINTQSNLKNHMCNNKCNSCQGHYIGKHGKYLQTQKLRNASNGSPREEEEIPYGDNNVLNTCPSPGQNGKHMKTGTSLAEENLKAAPPVKATQMNLEANGNISKLKKRKVIAQQLSNKSGSGVVTPFKQRHKSIDPPPKPPKTNTETQMKKIYQNITLPSGSAGSYKMIASPSNGGLIKGGGSYSQRIHSFVYRFQEVTSNSKIGKKDGCNIEAVKEMIPIRTSGILTSHVEVPAPPQNPPDNPNPNANANPNASPSTNRPNLPTDYTNVIKMIKRIEELQEWKNTPGGINTPQPLSNVMVNVKPKPHTNFPLVNNLNSKPTKIYIEHTDYTHHENHPINQFLIIINTFISNTFKNKFPYLDKKYIMILARALGLLIDEQHVTLNTFKTREIGTIIKEKILRNLLEVINYQNNINIPVYPNVNQVWSSGYKFFIGKGNNSVMVRKVLKQRWWWSANDNKDDLANCNLIWTQWRKNAIINMLPTGAYPYNNIVKKRRKHCMLLYIYHRYIYIYIYI